MTQTTRVYFSVEAPGRHLVIDGDLALLRELCGNVAYPPYCRREDPGQVGSTSATPKVTEGHTKQEK